MQTEVDLVVGDARDSCATNGVAQRHLLTLCPAMVPGKCVSHLLMGTGQHVMAPQLGPFMADMLTLSSHSLAFKTAFKDAFGLAMKTYSKVRWWSRWELIEQLGTNFSCIGKLLNLLVQRGIGDSTTKGLIDIYNNHRFALRCEIAMMLDLRPLVQATYLLEGDGLEGLLLVDKLEALRSLGRDIERGEPVLKNLAAVVRAKIDLAVGTEINEYFGMPYNKYFKGKITKVGTGDPTLYTIRYEDGTTLNAEDHELRPWLPVASKPEYIKYSRYALGAFSYLERRITNDCAEAYHFADNYHTWELARFFNPAWAAEHLNGCMVDSLIDLASIRHHALLEELRAEAHDYLTACVGVSIDESDIHIFTDNVLAWWRANGQKFPTWAKAARMVFALTPNSASAERVFSMLKHMFGDTQGGALGDYVEAALMLKYNQRKVG